MDAGPEEHPLRSAWLLKKVWARPKGPTDLPNLDQAAEAKKASATPRLRRQRVEILVWKVFVGIFISDMS